MEEGTPLLPPDLQGYIGLALVVGTGVATSTFTLSHAAETQFGPAEGVYVFTPMVISIGLVLAGTVLWAGGYHGAEMIRIGAGVFLGMAVFGLLVSWTVTHEFVRGGSVAHAPFVTVNSMTFGGFVGLVLGWFDARNRRTERRLERERNNFKRQTEELDEFASIVSHDLRNPLNVAKLQLRNARGSSDPETTAEAHAEMADSLDRMERIIEDVLTMAREGGAIEAVEPVSLATVARDSWKHVETGEAQLQVLDSGLVMADRSALEHILENLFRNSIEHGTGDSHEDQSGNQPTAETHEVVEDGGSGDDLIVRVGTLERGFFVEDTGPGIPEDVRATLFESGVTTNENGTGFGLSIVEKLVVAHGWEIRATSEEAGGARFEIIGVEFDAESGPDTWFTDLD